LPLPQTSTTTTTTIASTPTTTSAPTPPKPAPKPTPKPATKPTVKLIAVKVHGSAVQVTVVCHAATGHTCAATLSLVVTKTGAPSAKPAKRPVVIASARYKLAGGARRQLPVTLNRAGRSLLSARHRLAAQLRLTIGTRTVTRAVTFTRVAR
jgi:hypothetical protein